MNQHALSHAMWSTATPVHASGGTGRIIDPNTGKPFVAQPQLVVPSFQEETVVITPSGEDVSNSEGRPRLPLYSEVPERRLVIIPNESEYARNNRCLEELRRKGVR